MTCWIQALHKADAEAVLEPFDGQHFQVRLDTALIMRGWIVRVEIHVPDSGQYSNLAPLRRRVAYVFVKLDIRGKLHGFVPALKCEARVECEKITLGALAIIKFVHPARVEIEVMFT